LSARGSGPGANNAITAALRGLGYAGDEMTAHGFRSMASRRLNEIGWQRDAIERPLAQVEGNPVRAAYNTGQYLRSVMELLRTNEKPVRTAYTLCSPSAFAISTVSPWANRSIAPPDTFSNAWRDRCRSRS